MSSREQERSAADSSNPLHQTGILQHVLDYVGPGHWCFVSEVSSLWRDLYINLAERMAICEEKIARIPQMTLFSAVFASPSRVRHAAEHGLNCTTEAYQSAAGMYADVVTLKAAHAQGMQYSISAMYGAVRCNELSVVQFLRAQGCAWHELAFMTAARRGDTAMCAYLHAERCPWNTTTCYIAAISGHGSTLRWLREHGCPWTAEHYHTSVAEGGSIDAMLYLQQQGIVFTAEMLTEMLNTASAHSKLAAAQWLRQQGAEWPAVLHWSEALFDDPLDWSGDTLAWARAEGAHHQRFKWASFALASLQHQVSAHSISNIMTVPICLPKLNLRTQSGTESCEASDCPCIDLVGFLIPSNNSKVYTKCITRVGCLM
jgi:hypothetical protein